MPLTTIYICRHGYRLNWAVDPSTGTYTANVPTPTGIPTDPALSSYGARQAEQLAQRVVALEPPVNAVYSSPFYRCLQTVEPSYKLLQEKSRGSLSPLRVDAGVGEFFGQARFTHPAPAPVEVLVRHFDVPLEDYSEVRPNPNGETVAELHDRCARALHRLIARADAEQGLTAILVCSHAAALIAMGRALTGRMPADPDEEDFRCGTCSLSTYTRKAVAPVHAPREMAEWRGNVGVQGGWECVANGDCSFLENGEERTWKFTGDESFMSFPENGPPGPIEKDGTKSTKL